MKINDVKKTKVTSGTSETEFEAFKKETARLRKKNLPFMKEEDIDYVQAATNNIGKILFALRMVYRYSNSDMVDIFSDYIADESTVSRIIKQTYGRNINVGLLFALRRMFGISLDALADGYDQPKTDFPPELRRQLFAWVASQMQGESGK